MISGIGLSGSGSEDNKSNLFGLNIFISNQFIQYNTIFKHINIRIRTEAKAYQVLLLYNILTKCRRQ